GLGAQVGLGDHDDMQWWRALLVAQLHLVQASLDVPLHARLCERLHWEVVISHLGAILTPQTSPRIRARRGEGRSRSAPRLGNEGQAALACHLQGVVVAKVSIQPQVGHRKYGGTQLAQGSQHGGDLHKFWGKRGGRLGGVLAALWPPWTALGSGEFLLLSGRCGVASSFLCVAADALLAAYWKRPPFLDAYQGERAEGKPGDRLTVHAGEEPIEAMGVLAGFRDDDFIARDEVDISRAVHMLTKEHPKQHRPREDGGKPALDGAIAAAFASPAGEAQHRDASRHHQQGKGYPAQLAVSRRRHMGSEALERCYNVHHGLLRRLRVVVLVDDNSTLDLRQKPYQGANFGEGIVGV